MTNNFRLACSVVLFSVSVAVAGCGGSSTPKPTGTDGSVAAQGDMAMTGGGGDMATAMTGSCNLLKQDCSDPATKCTETLGGDPAMPTFAEACLPLAGMKKEGEKCTRMGTGNDAVGHDDCDKKLYCTANGLLGAGMTPPKYCRQFCYKTADCASAGPKSGCAVIDQMGVFGICVPGCAAFGTDCPANFTCAYAYGSIEDPMATVLACRATGSVTEGKSCKSSLECGPDSLCFDPLGKMMPVCVALCDATHACTGGKKCETTKFGSFPNGGGVCAM